MEDGLDFDFAIHKGICDNGEFYTSFPVFVMNYLVHGGILTVFHIIVKNKNVLD